MNGAAKCWCYDCLDQPSLGLNNPVVQRMIVCPTCSNKRCPRSDNHKNACTGSNAPGQRGSRYEIAPAPPGLVARLASQALRDAALWLLAASTRLHGTERAVEGVVVPKMPLGERVDVRLPDADVALSAEPVGYIAAPGSLTAGRRYIVLSPAPMATTKTILFRNATEHMVTLCGYDPFATIHPGHYASIAYDRTAGKWACGASGVMQSCG